MDETTAAAPPEAPASVAPIAQANQPTAAEDAGGPSVLPSAAEFDGVARPNLDPKNFLGFPVTDEIPTYEDINGRVILVDTGTFRALAVFLSSAWRFFPLTASGYAEIYHASDVTVTMTNANQYYTIGTATDGAESILDADAANTRIFVPGSAYPTSMGQGVYFAKLVMTVTVDTAGDLRAGILVNAAEQNNLVSVVQIANTGQEYIVTVAGFLDFSGSASQRTITARIQHPTGGAVATVKKYNLSLHSVR